MPARIADSGQHLEALRTFCVGEGIDPTLADEVWCELGEDMAESDRQVRDLHVRRIRVGGDVEFDHRFEQGVTVVYTKKNLRGKTSLLNVIKWAITGKNSLTPGVLERVKAVWVELAADDRIVTVHLQRTRSGARASCQVHIHECSIDDWSESREPLHQAVSQTGVENLTRDFFQQLLGLTVLSGTQASNRKGLDPFSLVNSPIDMAGFFNLVYVNQTDGYQMLIDRFTPNRQRAFESMVGLKGLSAIWTLRSLEAHLNADTLRDEWITKQRGIASQDRSGYEEAERIKTRTEQYRDLAKEVEELKRQRDDLIHEGRALVDRLCKAPQVAEARQVVQELSQKRDALFNVIEELTGLDRDLIRHKRKIKALTGELEANVALSDVAPLVCPRCKRELCEQDVALEARGQCSVCHHHAPVTSKEHQADVSARLHLEEQNLGRTEALVETKRQQGEQLRRQLQALEHRHARLVTEAHSNQADDDFAAEQRKLVEAADRLAWKSYELTMLKEQLTPTERGEVAQSEQTRKKLAVVTQLRAMLEQAREEESLAVRRRFEQRMLQILNEIQEEETVDDVYIGEDYLPVLTVGNTTRRFNKNSMSAGQLARVAIAFHIALLLHGLEDAGRMPSFLLLDSPRQQEMNLDDFRALCRRLGDIGRRYAGNAQIIIASSDAAALEAAPDAAAHRIIPADDGYVFSQAAPPARSPGGADG
jgi:hypothetical protein